MSQARTVSSPAPRAVPGRLALPAVPSADALAALALVACSLAALLLAANRPGQIVSGDWTSFFFPRYAFLGEQLRLGNIPGWNPYQFAGAPMAGDPQSGWMNLLAMVPFALLPPLPALMVFLALQQIVAGLGAYALGRTFGLGVAGAFIAGLGNQFPWFFAFNTWCPAFTTIAAWMPLLLLTSELALRATTFDRRLLWWALAGLTLSQVLVAWMGQGAFYAVLLFAAFLVFRTLLAPVTAGRAWRQRIADLAVNGFAIGALGLLIGAAGILPRLDTNRFSTVAGGLIRVESPWTIRARGSDPWLFLHNVLGGAEVSISWYIGGGVLALALVAPAIARRWPFLPFCAAVAAGGVILALPIVTPLHAALYAAIPRFAAVHGHYPSRIMTVVYIAFALLAGATVDALPRWRPRWFQALAIAAAPCLVAALLTLWAGETVFEPATFATLLAAGALVAVFPAAPHAGRVAVIAALAVIVVWNPTGRLLATRADPVWNEQPPVPLAALVAPAGASEFLATMPPGTARFAGFAPWLLSGDGVDIGYRSVMELPVTADIIVNTQATLLGLEDAQGYNPSQPLRYAELIDAMNGTMQEYHELNLLASGVDSPILDLLGLRYLVVPSPAELRQGLVVPPDFREVYADDAARVLENPAAFPRAWLVHEAIQSAPRETLRLLASGAVDARETALLEVPPPPLAGESSPRESATIARYEPDLIQIDVQAEAPALLVLADGYDPGWQATVNGEPAVVLVVDHALRGVAVPAGPSTVAFTYAPLVLTIGIWISLLTVGALAVALPWLAWRRRRGESVGGQ